MIVGPYCVGLNNCTFWRLLYTVRSPANESASKISVLTYETPSARPTVKIIDGETPEQKVKALIDILKDEAKAL